MDRCYYRSVSTISAIVEAFLLSGFLYVYLKSSIIAIGIKYNSLEVR